MFLGQDIVQQGGFARSQISYETESVQTRLAAQEQRLACYKCDRHSRCLFLFYGNWLVCWHRRHIHQIRRRLIVIQVGRHVNVVETTRGVVDAANDVVAQKGCLGFRARAVIRCTLSAMSLRLVSDDKSMLFLLLSIV